MPVPRPTARTIATLNALERTLAACAAALLALHTLLEPLCGGQMLLVLLAARALAAGARLLGLASATLDQGCWTRPVAGRGARARLVAISWATVVARGLRLGIAAAAVTAAVAGAGIDVPTLMESLAPGATGR